MSCNLWLTDGEVFKPPGRGYHVSIAAAFYLMLYYFSLVERQIFLTIRIVFYIFIYFLNYWANAGKLEPILAGTGQKAG